MAFESYLRHFQDKVDEVEGSAFLIWKRFNRLGLPGDILDIELEGYFIPSPEPDTGFKLLDIAQLILDADMRRESHNKKIFRNLDSTHVALIQLGKYQTLERITEEQTQKRNRIYDVLIGTDVILDFQNAISGLLPYNPKEVIYVAKDFGKFTDHVLSRVDDVRAIDTFFEPARAAKIPDYVSHEQKVKENAEKPVEIPEISPPKEIQIDYCDILKLTREAIKKIDEMLLSRI